MKKIAALATGLGLYLFSFPSRLLAAATSQQTLYGMAPQQEVYGPMPILKSSSFWELLVKCFVYIIVPLAIVIGFIVIVKRRKKSKK